MYRESLNCYLRFSKRFMRRRYSLKVSFLKNGDIYLKMVRREHIIYLPFWKAIKTRMQDYKCKYMHKSTDDQGRDSLWTVLMKFSRNEGSWNDTDIPHNTSELRKPRLRNTQKNFSEWTLVHCRAHTD